MVNNHRGEIWLWAHRGCRLLLCRPPDKRDTSSVVTKYETEILQYIANENMIQCHARCTGHPRQTVHKSGKGAIACRKKARRKHKKKEMYWSYMTGIKNPAVSCAFDQRKWLSTLSVVGLVGCVVRVWYSFELFISDARIDMIGCMSFRCCEEQIRDVLCEDVRICLRSKCKYLLFIWSISPC